MKKKLLVLMLALALVLAFSGMAMAENPKLSVDLTADNGPASIVFNNEGAVSGGTVFAFYDVYCSDKATKVTVTVNVADGYDFGLGGSTPSVPEGGKVTFDLTDEENFNFGPAGSTETSERFFYNVKLHKVSVTIDDKLYKDKDDTKTYGKTSDKEFLVPCDDPNAYVKITVTGAEKFDVTGAGTPDANGFAKLPTLDDFDEAATVKVSINGTVFESKQFDLLRPTLYSINFNETSDAGTNSGKKTLTAKNGIYSYTTEDQIKSDWNPVYFKVNPLCDEASVSLTPTKTKNSKGFYNQTMTRPPYEIIVTISVGEGDDEISQDYSIFLINEDYSGPTVKTFSANEKDGGKGDDYLTVVDNENQKLYVFLPEGVKDFYASVTMDGNAKALNLNGSIKEGYWYQRSTSLNGKTLTYYDGVDKPYSYDVIVYSKADEDNDDASLKSLKVRSGSKSSNADDVDIDFDPDVLDYAFPVSSSDVYLNLTAAAKNSNAKVFINNQETTSLTVKDLDTDEVTEFEILVVAGDNETTQTYTVTVNGSTGLLQSLSASNVVGLTPAFDADFNTYTAYTAAGTNSTYIVALAKNYSSDYVQVSKANFNAYGQVTSYTALTRAVQGAASVTGELKTGTNIFRIDVLSSASATSAKASYYLTINVPTADPKCVVSSQKLYINGKAQTLSAYNIAGNNYLKLRDVAALLDGTVKEMKVDWDASKWTASMVMPGTFVKRGDELTTLTPPSKYALSTQYFTYNARPVFPLAYNVTGTGDATGSNYVMLRDVASLLDFGVTYTPTTQTININTASEYIPGLEDRRDRNNLTGRSPRPAPSL